ncbi:PAS domain S-box protein [Reichenbachiella ulvae]|uniref:PAS domain S-box protein n=1 Tax=Reichenbachiella ulvae TaxID=2980104 RepID=A0ABT3D239_9BACT|nr:PAS domain S-box protein [Reichenbachiella ulvae]MCV9389503.1 PAS domain S-box protein [Reichenbachiella ulvae]
MYGGRLGILQRKKNAEDKYRELFENSLEGIYVADGEGSFTTVNPAMVKMFGYESREEFCKLVPGAGSLMVNQQDRMKIRELLQMTGEVNGIEHQVYKKNGDIIWVRSNIRVHFNGSNPIKYEGSLEDTKA